LIGPRLGGTARSSSPIGDRRHPIDAARYVIALFPGAPNNTPPVPPLPLVPPNQQQQPL